MPLLVAGQRLGPLKMVCVGDACREVEEVVRPGEVVEVRYVVDPPITRERLYMVAKVLEEVRRRISRLSVIYLEVSDDGRHVVLQVSPDPVVGEMISWVTIAQIVIIVAMIIVLIFFVKVLIDSVYRVIVEVPKAVQQLPKGARVALYALVVGLGIALAGAGIGYAWRSIRS